MIPYQEVFEMLAALALSAALLGSPSPSDAPAPMDIQFVSTSQVFVSGYVADTLNYSVYTIDGPCVGTGFNVPAGNCIPQHVTKNSFNTIAGHRDYSATGAAFYNGKRGVYFGVSGVPSCGPIQWDIYGGEFQPTIDASGNHDFVMGGIIQQPACKTSTPTPEPSTSTTPPPCTCGSQDEGHFHCGAIPAGCENPPTTTPTPSSTPPVTSTTPVPVVSTSSTPAVEIGTATSAELPYTGSAWTVNLLWIGLGLLGLGVLSALAGWVGLRNRRGE